MITTEQVANLRQQTGAGLMDAKRALEQAGSDFDKAVSILRERGVKLAASKGGRATGQGLIEAYIHAGGKVGSLVELACETDFVARTDKFKQLAHDIAMQVAAAPAQYLAPADIPNSLIRQAKVVYKRQLAKEGKAGKLTEKIIQGKLEKFYSEVCLLKQPFIKDDKRQVEDLINEAIAALGENIKVVRFAAFTLSGTPRVCPVIQLR